MTPFFPQHKLRNRKCPDPSDFTSSEEDAPPPKVVTRTRHKAGTADWNSHANDQSSNDESSQSREPDRLNAIEASLKVMADHNRQLMAQNSALIEKVADLQQNVAIMQEKSRSGSIITKVEPLSARLPKKVVAKILDHHYVDFRDLLDQAEEEDEPEQTPLGMDSLGNQVILKHKAHAKPRKSISWSDWGVAWSRFISILSPTAQDHTFVEKLSQHYEVVYGLMKSGCRWRQYDEKFRKLVETDPEVSFGSIHLDLFQAARSPDKVPHKPQPLCLKFNSVAGCVLQACKYAHVCRICSLPHPAFRCSRRFQSFPGTHYGRDNRSRSGYASRSEGEPFSSSLGKGPHNPHFGGHMHKSEPSFLFGRGQVQPPSSAQSFPPRASKKFHQWQPRVQGPRF